MEKQKWKVFKKDLPKNWAQIIHTTLQGKGVHLSPHQIVMVRYGSIKNHDWQLLVWQEIAKLSKLTSKIKRRLTKLKQAA